VEIVIPIRAGESEDGGAAIRFRSQNSKIRIWRSCVSLQSNPWVNRLNRLIRL
jgi:hypothetical protein